MDARELVTKLHPDALVRELAPSPPLEEGGSPIAPVVDWLSTDDDAFHVVVVRKVRVE